MNSPKRPCLSTRFDSHFGHFSSRIWSGLAAASALLGRDDLSRRLALGIAGAGEELPKRPRLSAIGLPQFSQSLFDLAAFGVGLGRLELARVLASG